ncbi:MAG: hypothetical protein U0165_14320 [Polyangiaceae bacterium]
MLPRHPSKWLLVSVSAIAAVSVLVGSAEAQKKTPRKMYLGRANDEGELASPSRVTAFGVSDFPQATLPKMPADHHNDASFARALEPGHDDPPEISLLDTSHTLKRWRSSARTKKLSSSFDSLSVQLRGNNAYVTTQAESMPPNWYYAQYGQAVGTASVYCANGDHATMRLSPVRSEQVSAASGGLELAVRDYWLDSYNCELTLDRLSKVHAKEIATAAGKPVMWAFRSAVDELTVMFPWTTGVTVDTSVGQAELSVGALYQLRMPIRPGATSSMLVGFSDYSMFNAWQASIGQKLGLQVADLQHVTIGVDIVQSVSDAAPSITVRVNGDKEPTPPDSSSSAAPPVPR